MVDTPLEQKGKQAGKRDRIKKKKRKEGGGFPERGGLVSESRRRAGVEKRVLLASLALQQHHLSLKG